MQHRLRYLPCLRSPSRAFVPRSQYLTVDTLVHDILILENPDMHYIA